MLGSVQNHTWYVNYAKIAWFSGNIYTASANFIRPPVVTVATNLNSAKMYWSWLIKHCHQSKGRFWPNPTIPGQLCVIRTALASIWQTFAVLMFNSKIAVLKSKRSYFWILSYEENKGKFTILLTPMRRRNWLGKIPFLKSN